MAPMTTKLGYVTPVMPSRDGTITRSDYDTVRRRGLTPKGWEGIYDIDERLVPNLKTAEEIAHDRTVLYVQDRERACNNVAKHHNDLHMWDDLLLADYPAQPTYIVQSRADWVDDLLLVDCDGVYA